MTRLLISRRKHAFVMTALSTLNDLATLASASQREQELERAMQTAIDHHRKQEYAEAAALYASVLAIESNHADAHYHLGVLRMQTGEPAEAVEHFEAALGEAPNFAQLWVYYINALTQSNQKGAARAALDLARQRGLPPDAFDVLRARIDGEPEPVTPEASATPAASAESAAPADAETPAPAEPDTPTAALPDTPSTTKLDVRRASAKELKQYSDLFNSGKLDAAAKVARRLTKRYPSHGECWFALAYALQHTGEYVESTEAAERAATLLPDDIRAQSLLANRLYLTRQYQRAEKLCRELLEKHPDNAALHRTLGATLQATGRETDGIAEFRRAVELSPRDALEIDALANSLIQHGLFDEAEAAFRQSLELSPLQAATHSNLLFCLMHKPDLDAASAFAQFCEFGRRHEQSLRAQRPRHANDRDPSRRLRVGLVSGDLLNHPVAYFLLPLVEQLARDPGLSLQIYSNYVVADGFTKMIRDHADGWHPIFGMSDAAIAQKIRDDRIDILVDLSGHTGRNRLVAFAQKPAPVQVSWIGNPATTGLTTVDYYLSDRFFTPLDEFAGRFTEKLVFLPALAPFKPHPDAPEVNELPALKNGYVTFGSFSRMVKIGPEVVSLWARVLQEVPNSRMLIGAISSKEQMSKLIGQFVERGIDPTRISFMPRGNTTTYLQQHHMVDVCLDAFPFAGSTTTMHALWMGVPTITLPGSSMASRGSTGWLLHLGLDAAFVARDKDDYVHKCVALAADPEALATVRRELRQHCMGSPIVSASTIANAASRAFRIMWQRWCAGLPPEHFEVEAQAGDAPPAPDTATPAVTAATAPQDQQATLSREFVETLTVLLEKQQFGEAEALARQFTALLPQAGEGWHMLAASLRGQGRFADALAPLREAHALLPHDDTIHQEFVRLSQYLSDR